jgi:hypothetical protein
MADALDRPSAIPAALSAIPAALSAIPAKAGTQGVRLTAVDLYTQEA